MRYMHPSYCSISENYRQKLHSSAYSQTSSPTLSKAPNRLSCLTVYQTLLAWQPVYYKNQAPVAVAMPCWSQRSKAHDVDDCVYVHTYQSGMQRMCVFFWESACMQFSAARFCVNKKAIEWPIPQREKTDVIYRV